MKRTPAASIAIGFVALAVAGCGSASSSSSASNPATRPAVTTTGAASMPTTQPAAATIEQPPFATPSRNMPRGYISEETWAGGEWPFAVSEGTLMCAPPSRVTFTANREMYWVNGAAKQTRTFEDLNEIWKDDGSGLKVNIGPVIEAGLALC